MVYGIHKGCRGGYCPIVVQYDCNSVGNADGEGQGKDDMLVHNSFEVNDREDASSMVTAGAAANTTVKNSRASRESGLLCSQSHGGNYPVKAKRRITPWPLQDILSTLKVPYAPK